MECYKCGDGIESGKNFIPIDLPGTPNRRWVCEECANELQKQEARKDQEAIDIARIFDPNFLREE